MRRDQIDGVADDMAYAANCLLNHGMSWAAASSLASEVLKEVHRRETLVSDSGDQ